MADDGKTESTSSPKAKPKRAKAKTKAKTKAKAKRKSRAKTKTKAKAATKRKASTKAKTTSKAKAKAKSRAKAKAKSRAKTKPKAKSRAKAKAKSRSTRSRAKAKVSPKAKVALEVAESEATLEAKLAATEPGAPAPEVEIETLAVPEGFQTPEPDPLPPLPMLRGRDFVLAMVRDPESAFIYWELTSEGSARARAALGNQPSGLTLRVYLSDEDADGEAEIRDFPVEDWIGRFVLFPGAAGRRVVAAIGYKSAEGFAHVARATAVQLPRRWPKPAPAAFTRVVAAPKPTAIEAARPGFVPPKVTFVPERVDFTPEGVDAEVIQAFRIEQAVQGTGPKSDLKRIWSAEALDSDRRRFSSDGLVRGGKR